MERLTKDDMGTKIISECGKELCKETCERVEDCETCPIAKAINKLAEYEDAEEQGLLLRLPCKVGDTVWVKMQFGSFAEAEVRDYVHFLTCGFCLTLTSKRFDKQHIPFSEIGKTVFLTKEEAEQALAERKGE